MIRGLYTAASGLITGLRQQEVVANNLANISTTGYRGETSASASFEKVLAYRVGRAPLPVPLTLRRMLGVVGTGAYVAQRVSFQGDGSLLTTDAPLDVAIRGDGFFAVRGPAGTLYTRDGHFRLAPGGRLVTADGFEVLGSDGEPIVLDSSDVEITPRGVVFAFQQSTDPVTGLPVRVPVQVAELQIVRLPAGSLVRAGDTAFVLAPGASALAAGADTVVLQGALEESNIDLARAATQMLTVSRQFSSNQQVFRTLDESLEEAVRNVGRVA